MESDFKRKYEETISSSLNILVAMFGFGLSKGYSKLRSIMDQLYNPIKDKLKSQWDHDVFLETIRAEDPSKEEGILYAKEGIQYNLYQLEVAIKFKKPEWIYFYLLGHLLGEVIDNELTIADFKMYLQQLPKSFKVMHGEKIVFLINSFGEDHGILLKFSNDDVELLEP